MIIFTNASLAVNILPLLPNSASVPHWSPFLQWKWWFADQKKRQPGTTLPGACPETVDRRCFPGNFQLAMSWSIPSNLRLLQELRKRFRNEWVLFRFSSREMQGIGKSCFGMPAVQLLNCDFVAGRWKIGLQSQDRWVFPSSPHWNLWYVAGENGDPCQTKLIYWQDWHECFPLPYHVVFHQANWSSLQ